MSSNAKWTSDDLRRRAVQRRAIEAVIWGMSAVNTDLMFQALVQLKDGPNQIVYWSGLPNWKNQTLRRGPIPSVGDSKRSVLIATPMLSCRRQGTIN